MSAVRIAIDEKRYANGAVVIANFQLTLATHEFVCLVGPSGCGKTTLLNLISGLDGDFTGTIQWPNPNNRLKVGYIFQNPRLLPWRTVRENITLPLTAGQYDAATIDAMLASMDLTDVQHAYPGHLSLGMNRRVSILRAFATDPELLLMDEPFVSLDPATARQARFLLLQLWRQRPHTVLFVTHDLREAIVLADRLIFLAAKPMSVIGCEKVTLNDQQRQDEQAVEAFRNDLMTRVSGFGYTF
ncbi:MAG: ABC transporter ATP-binding protein [Methylococcales bacterium]|nr:ABC transporter ATP-binding protein [Methylococcales bacterium]